MSLQLTDTQTLLRGEAAAGQFGAMFSAGKQRQRLWAGLGFSGLKLLASALNRYLSFLAATSV